MDAPKAKEFGVIDRVSLCAVKLLCGAILIRTLVFDINSTALNSKAPEKVVFHLVTNAMKSWFAMNMDNPRGVTVEVQKFEDFKWLNASYVPVLKQLQDSDTQSYYFSGHNDDGRTPIKFRNPKYLSMLNHLNAQLYLFTRPYKRNCKRMMFFNKQRNGGKLVNLVIYKLLKIDL